VFKTILVAVDGSETCIKGVRYAVNIAKRNQAKVRILYVVDIKLLEGPFLRDVSASLAIVPIADYQKNIATILEERGKAAVAVVEQLCEQEGIECEPVIKTGLVSRTICTEADDTDLIVVGRRGEHVHWSDGFLGTTVEAVARRAKKPVLVTSDEYHEMGVIVMAYDGSSHANRALSIAAGVAGEWELPLRVVSVSDQETAAASLRSEVDKLLTDRGLSFEMQVLEGEPDEEIAKVVESVDGPLLVMGAYGHSRVRELILGSTTVQVLRKTTCPVLLYR